MKTLIIILTLLALAGCGSTYDRVPNWAKDVHTPDGL